VNQVCPDRQLLSVYFDGELPSPWKEKMEAHIAGCPACTRRLEAYRRVSLGKAAAAAGEGDAGLEPARERVWQKLEQSMDAYSMPAKPRAVRRGAAWRRSVSIPLPAVAAAIVLLVALAFLAVMRVTSTEGMSGMTFASDAELETPGIIPVADMEDVLQYLGSRDNGDIIILRLPESRNFVNYGEPSIVRAADYSRTVPGRRKP
jgi:anti-sigma factor RsiW